jgi:tetratricopeptide (TPR) repeat protein
MAAVLQTAIEDLPDRFEAYEMLGNHYIQTGEEEKAVALMEQFVRRGQAGPSVLKAKLFLARIYYRGKDLDRAMELADNVLKENPADMQAHYLKGTILAGLGDFPGAIAEYRAVLRQEPQNIRASLSLAQAHLSNNEMALAEDTYKKVLEIDPQEKRARFGLVDVYRRKGEFILAKEQLEKVLKRHPNDTKALMALGDLALLTGDAGAARDYFSTLSSLQPDSVSYNYYKEGMVNLLEQEKGEAASLFEKALQADPDFVPALNQLIDMLVKEKAFDKAIRRCRDQITRSPVNAHYYVLLGHLQVASDDYENARTSFEKALEINPNNPDALFSLAHLAQLSGSVNGALLRYETLRERYPNNVAILLVMATLMEKEGQFLEASAMYKAVLQKDPKIYIAANNLAFYYAEHEPTPENLGEGERLILPILKQFKDNPNFVDTAAWIYYRQGHLSKARDMLLAVEDKIGNRPTIQYHLGMIYLGLEQKAEAKKHLELSISSKQDFRGREEAERLLKQLS